MRKFFVFSILFFLFIGFVAADDLLGLIPKKKTVVEIPNFVGQNIDEIEDSLKSLPYDVETESVYDDSAPKGSILLQTPAAGTTKVLSARLPLVLHFTVSLGQEYVTLPTLSKMTPSQAEDTIKNLGLKVKIEKRLSSKSDVLLDFYPPSGSKLTKGSTVTLFVSEESPKESITVPNLIGLSRGDAVFTLYSARLSPGEILIDSQENFSSGTVVSQSPPPGSLVLPNSKVSFRLR